MGEHVKEGLVLMFLEEAMAWTNLPPNMEEGPTSLHPTYFPSCAPSTEPPFPPEQCQGGSGGDSVALYCFSYPSLGF